jgi:hypothetical protein
MKMLLLFAAVMLGMLVLLNPPSPVANAPLPPELGLPMQPSGEGLTGYDTLEEAGVRGIERAYRCSHAYECSGSIALRPSDGKYVVGPVRSDYAGDSVQVNHSVPPGWKLVGDFHTHPCNDSSHDVGYFSPQDMAEVTATGVTGFMGDLCTGEVHEFTPGRDKPNDVYLEDQEIYLSKGRVIGHIAVDGKSMEPDTGI